jgi:hypothetical protein
VSTTSGKQLGTGWRELHTGTKLGNSLWETADMIKVSQNEWFPLVLPGFLPGG